MIYFVGDKPSKCSIDPRTAFVGTNAHLTVLTWIHRMNLSLNDTMLFNFDSFVKEIKTKKLIINEDDQIVALGKEASEFLHQAVLPEIVIKALKLECYVAAVMNKPFCYYDDLKNPLGEHRYYPLGEKYERDEEN